MLEDVERFQFGYESTFKTQGPQIFGYFLLLLVLTVLTIKYDVIIGTQFWHLPNVEKTGDTRKWLKITEKKCVLPVSLDSKVDLIDIVGMGFWGAHVQQISAKDFSQMFFFMINSLTYWIYI